MFPKRFDVTSLDIQCIAKRLSILDNRSYHPEDYEDDAQHFLDFIGCDIVYRRLKYLEENKELIGGYFSLRQFMITGKLYDEYVNRLLYSEE